MKESTGTFFSYVDLINSKMSSNTFIFIHYELHLLFFRFERYLSYLQIIYSYYTFYIMLKNTFIQTQSFSCTQS